MQEDSMYFFQILIVLNLMISLFYVGDESVITVSSVGSAALLPGVANVPAQLKSPNAYGERSTPSSPHKTNASYSAADDMTRQFQRINFVENSEPKVSF